MLNVALVVGFNSDLEAQSIRASLEYFGAKVITYWIGRPKEFIDILSGKGLYSDINYVVFCFHGEEGKFVMEELGEDIYEQDEPRGYFGAAEIYKYAKLHNTHIVNSGCTLGGEKTSRIFFTQWSEIVYWIDRLCGWKCSTYVYNTLILRDY